jgi:hypothetical protein
VISYATPTAATLRMRSLPTQRPAFVLSDVWQQRAIDRVVDVPARTRLLPTNGPIPAHNSIPTAPPALAPATVDATAERGGVDAKQAAPPRGVPR